MPEDTIGTELEDEFTATDSSSGITTTKRSKLVMILLWVIGGLAALILMTLISYFMAKEVKTSTYREEQNITIAPTPAPWAIFSFPKEFRTNTADVGEPHFIQASVSLAYDTKNTLLAHELFQRQTQMKHIINIILGDKKKEDVSTTLQKLHLAEEIKSQVNMILGKGKIEDVYFKEFVVS